MSDRRAHRNPLPPSNPSPTKPPPRLLDQVRDLALARGHPEAAIQSLVRWCRSFILFHDKRHPKDMGAAEIARYLKHVVRTENEPLPALEASGAALEFSYGDVLHQDVGALPRPRPPRLLQQVQQVLRVKHYALSTEQNYVPWITRFILFHDKRQPREKCGEAEDQDVGGDRRGQVGELLPLPAGKRKRKEKKGTGAYIRKREKGDRRIY